MLRNVPRLLALGALGACFGLLAVYALLVFLTVPRATGGIDLTNAAVTWISVGGVIVALVAVHLVIARQLWQLAAATPARSPR